MADYWKSLPRKFCEFCKCWITDNKPSVEFHERGKKHKENVQKKIAELRKKGLKDHKEKQQLDKMFKKMETAALQSFKKDVERDPSLSVELPAEPPKASTTADKPNESLVGKKPNKLRKKHAWLQVINEEGQTYYWNSKTQESRWEAPKDGFMSLTEQATWSLEKTGKLPCGPQPQQVPFGKWIAVGSDKPKNVDLELPETKEKVEFKVVHHEEEVVKFREKRVKTMAGGDSGTVQFKKRKINSQTRQNIRRKVDDDDDD